MAPGLTKLDSDSPAVLGFERKRFKDEKIQGFLNQIAWFPYTMIIYAM